MAGEGQAGWVVGLAGRGRGLAEVDRSGQRWPRDPARSGGETTVHPGLAGGHLISPNSLGWFTPYYGSLHRSNGTVVWQGYNPGAIDAWARASGSGSGLFGTGAESGTLVMDWWFSYRATETQLRPHGLCALPRLLHRAGVTTGSGTPGGQGPIDQTVVGYQYNYKPTVSNSVLDVRDDNINVND